MALSAIRRARPILGTGLDDQQRVIRSGHDPLEAFEVTLSYLGPDGSEYEERFALHPDHILKETSSAPSNTDNPIKLGQQGVSALQALVRTIRAR